MGWGEGVPRPRRSAGFLPGRRPGLAGADQGGAEEGKWEVGGQAARLGEAECGASSGKFVPNFATLKLGYDCYDVIKAPYFYKSLLCNGVVRPPFHPH